MKANETVAAAAVQDPAPAAVPQIFRAIPAIMWELSAVKKEKTTQEGARRFAYRGIDDVMNAMWPLLSKHGKRQHAAVQHSAGKVLVLRRRRQQHPGRDRGRRHGRWR